MSEVSDVRRPENPDSIFWMDLQVINKIAASEVLALAQLIHTVSLNGDFFQSDLDKNARLARIREAIQAIVTDYVDTNPMLGMFLAFQGSYLIDPDCPQVGIRVSFLEPSFGGINQKEKDAFQAQMVELLGGDCFEVAPSLTAEDLEAQRRQTAEAAAELVGEVQALYKTLFTTGLLRRSSDEWRQG